MDISTAEQFREQAAAVQEAVDRATTTAKELAADGVGGGPEVLAAMAAVMEGQSTLLKIITPLAADAAHPPAEHGVLGDGHVGSLARRFRAIATSQDLRAPQWGERLFHHVNALDDGGEEHHYLTAQDARMTAAALETLVKLVDGADDPEATDELVGELQRRAQQAGADGDYPLQVMLQMAASQLRQRASLLLSMARMYDTRMGGTQ